MRLLSHSIALTAALVAGTSVNGSPIPIESTAGKVLAFYQVEEFLSDTGAQVEATLKNRKRDLALTKERATEILGYAQRIYRKRNLFSVFRVAYPKVATRATLEPLYQWMLSARGLKLRQGYTQLYKTNEAQWRDFYEHEAATLLRPNRKNALQTFIKSTELTQLLASKRIGADYAVEMALQSYAPAGQRETAAAIKSRLRTRRNGYVDNGQEQAMILATSLTRDLKNEEIDDASRFATSAVGQAATQAFIKALDFTMESAAATLASTIGARSKENVQ